MYSFSIFVACEESYINFGDYNLEQKFHHYNTLLFNNKILPCPVLWADLKGLAGLTTYTSRGREVLPGTLKIQISTRFKRSEQELDSTLIHEMIHAYLAITGYPQENHGFRFLAMAHQTEKLTGIPIAVTDTLTGLELTNETFVLTTVLIRHKNGQLVANFYGGTAFDKPDAQNQLKAFWGVPGKMPEGDEILVVKLKTSLGQKYGLSRTIKQTNWTIISAAEVQSILQQGQIIFKIVAGSVPKEFANDNLPMKETLVALRTNTRTNETVGTFYMPQIARDHMKMEVVKEKWHSWFAAGYNVDIFVTNTTIFNRNFSMQRDPSKGSYYIFKPDTLAELHRNASYLFRWHQ